MTKEAEILNITLEECAEVIQAIAKCFRFGFDSYNPNNPNVTNKMRLEEEVGDTIAMFEILQEFGVVNSDAIKLAAKNKREKLKTWSNIFKD
jgi:NTP pyrophosphatase (non-canonical NTP hydrolase)